MGSLRQIVTMTAMSLRGIPLRLGASLVIVIAFAGAVAVLICVLALASSFVDTVARTGRIDRAIVLSRGAESELVSSLSRQNAATILDTAGIKHTSDSKPIGSAETLGSVRLTDGRTGLDTVVALRGVGGNPLDLRPELHLVSGRMFHSGLRELIVGRAAQRRVAGLAVGSRIPFAEGDWTIVGAFESAQDWHESELLADEATVLAAIQRNSFNSVTVLLDSAAAFDQFKAALSSNPSLSLDVHRESDYLAALSAPTATLLKGIAYTIGLLMGLGATFACINAMYSVVTGRSIEIATLRAIGYNAAPVLIAVMIEAMLLALAGALVGAVVSWFFFNGNSINTVPEKARSVINYTLTIGQGLIAVGILCASGIGLIGGLFPAIRAARLPIAAALRKV